MKRHIYTINKTGINHSTCEDVVYASDEEGVFIICDGVSSSVHGAVGAKSLINTLSKVFAEKEYKQFLVNAEPKKVRESVCKIINVALNDTAKDLNCNIIDLSCTLITVVIVNNTAVIIHAGDGAVFGMPNVEESSTPSIISSADNDNENKVYSAGNKLQINRMRVFRLRCDDYKAFILGSDGFTDNYYRPERNGFSGYNLADVYEVNSNIDLEKLVDENHLKRPSINDDISAIIIKFDTEIPTTCDLPRKNNVTVTKNSVPIKKALSREEQQKETTNTTIVSDSKPKTHYHSETKKRKTSNTSVFVMLVLLVIFSVGLSLFVYKDMENKNRVFDEEITQLSSEVDELAKELSDIYISINETTQEKTQEIENENSDTNTTQESEEATTDSSTNEEVTSNNYEHRKENVHEEQDLN